MFSLTQAMAWAVSLNRTSVGLKHSLSSSVVVPAGAPQSNQRGIETLASMSCLQNF